MDEAVELGRLTGLHATFAKAISLQVGEYGNAVLSREKPISVERVPLPGKEPRVLLLCEFTDFWFGTMHLDFGKHQLKSVSVVRDVVAEKAKDKPVFITGDWNATPKSKTLAAMREFMAIVSKEDSLTFHGFKNHPRNEGKPVVIAVNASPWIPWDCSQAYRSKYGSFPWWNVSDGVEISQGKSSLKGSLFVVYKDARADITSSVPQERTNDVAFAFCGFCLAMTNGVTVLSRRADRKPSPRTSRARLSRRSW